MELILRILLPVYFLLYFGIAFVVKSMIVAKRSGINPLVLPKEDNAHGLIGRYFKLTIILVFIYVLIFSWLPAIDTILSPVKALKASLIQYMGIACLAFALVWTLIAQMHMRNSWRIGIDANVRTELVTSGLFKFSRNPVFFGMILSLVGLFLATPNAATGMILIMGYVLIQIQIRLEEEFLTAQHGRLYLAYKRGVRRFI